MSQNERPSRHRRAGAVAALTATAVLLTDRPADAADAPAFDPSNVQSLSQGLLWYALTICIIGICVSAGLWAMGSKGQNPGQELTGKKGIILCCTAAFFLGAFPALVNWLQGEANQLEKESSIHKNEIVDDSPCPAGYHIDLGSTNGAAATTPCVKD